MAYTNIIAAIDLGTSHIVGMVGTKNVSGALSVIACEVEKSEKVIRRGCVLNIKETAGKIQRLILKMENQLEGTKIAKVYIGVGGQSIHSIHYPVSRMLGKGEVTEALLKELDAECRQFRPDMEEVLEIVSPVYFLDNRKEKKPVGMIASRIESHYQLIVGRPVLLHSVTTHMREQLQSGIAGIFVAPLALADLILTDEEKERGCVLLDFGAGVTSVTIFKNGHLVGLSVIPLGSSLITRDLMSLNLSETEAERIKKTYGNALWEKENEKQTVPVSFAEGWQSGEVKLSLINEIVEARSREIIENVYARLVDAGVDKEPDISIVIAGNGASLKKLREAISKRFNRDVDFAYIPKERIASGGIIANNPEYMMAAALLFKGTEDCSLRVAPPERKQPEQKTVEFVEADEERIEEEQKEPSVPQKTPQEQAAGVKTGKKTGVKTGVSWGYIRSWGQKIEHFGGELFKDEDYNP